MSDAELVAGAGDLMALGLAKSHDEVVRLTNVAGQLGMNMNQLVLALTNQTTARFDTLGVSVDGFKEKVAELEAAGMSADDAFKEAFLQQAEAQIERVGSAADTTKGSFMQLEAATASMTGRMKMDLADNLSGLVNYMATGFTEVEKFRSALDTALSVGIVNQREYNDMLTAGSNSTSYMTTATADLEEQIKSYAKSQEDANEQAQGYAIQAALAAGATWDEVSAMYGLSTAIEELPEAASVELDIETQQAIDEIDALREKMETDLGKAIDVLITAQMKWKESVADDLVGGLEEAGLEGDAFLERLEAIDAVLGTELAAEHRFNVAYDLEIDELLQKLIEDPESFAADAGAFVNYFMPLEESVATAQEKVNLLQADLDTLAKEYEAIIEYGTANEAEQAVQNLQDGLDGIVGNYQADVNYELSDPYDLHGMVLTDQEATYTINYVTTGEGGGNEAAGGPVYAAAGLPIHAAAGYWVGEVGPEPFFPAVDGRIISNSEAMRAIREGRSGGGAPVYVTINTPVNMADKAFVERELAPYITSALREALRV
jgi:hypothetical protein